jgi:hypothetical protein
MAKCELKGKIMVVTPTETVGQNNLKKQLVYLNVPAYRDSFGEVKGNDEIWELAALGDNIDKLGITTASEGVLGTATVFINSNTVKSKDTGKDMYILNAVLYKFEVKAKA